MKTNHFLPFLAFFAALFTFFACSGDSEPSGGSSSVEPSSSSNELALSSGSDGGNIGVIEPLNRFEAQPASEIGNAKIKYSYSYDGYDFYYIYLGELKNMPLFSYTAEYHDGITKTTYTVSNTETIKQSVEQTITNSSEIAKGFVEEYTYSTTDKKKISGEIKLNTVIPIGFVQVKAAGEASWDKYTTDNKNSSFHETTSLTNTVTTGTEYTKTTLISRSWELGKDNKAGYYKYTLFSASDVYLYVIKDATGVISYEFKECLIPEDGYFWRFDYSENPSFRKSDATSFEFDISMLNNLPKPEIQLSAPTDPTDQLVRKNATLSSMGSSYADIDGDIATYTRASVANRLDEIDLIAYCGSGTGWCKNNSIYSPLEIDLFYRDVDYLGGTVYFYEIPAAQAGIFKTATKLSEIAPTLNSLNVTDLYEIPIVAGKVFLVGTSERNRSIVIIKSVGNQSVDLEIIQIPD